MSIVSSVVNVLREAAPALGKNIDDIAESSAFANYLKRFLTAGDNYLFPDIVQDDVSLLGQKLLGSDISMETAHRLGNLWQKELQNVSSYPMAKRLAVYKAGRFGDIQDKRKALQRMITNANQLLEPSYASNKTAQLRALNRFADSPEAMGQDAVGLYQSMLQLGMTHGDAIDAVRALM